MNRVLAACLCATSVVISAARAADAPKPPAAAAAASTPEGQMERGEDFLAKIGAEKGVKTLPSGLRIKIDREGQGASPTASDVVKVHYRGTLIDGSEFDSSYKRNSPATFPLGGVIPCWTEGLQLMKPGGKATLYCPAQIAYGKTGHPPVIPGGATLIFEVELLEVQGKTAKKDAP